MMILFYIAGTVAVVSTVGVIVQSNIVHALIYLILSLLAVAVVFFSLGAPFVAVLEAIIYAGAIMVLFLFVIMMLNMGQHTIDQEKTWMAAKDWALPAGLAAILLAQLLYVLRDFQVDIVPNEVGVLEVSALLFGPYVLAVELASILLLAGLVSAYHLAKK
ncbi:MAG: NADH-quinone oxidoreductase subunit J [Proteobacteria bacterium]|nr:NADH-quinone oxidoreductase subunit J [Pseudomonadota bacterium]